MRLSENLRSSEVSSYQQGQLIEKEDQKSLLMIGGIRIFLPSSQDKAREDVAEEAIKEGQPTMTVIEEEKVEQMQISAPTEEEHANEMLTPWEMELEMLEDWLNNPEPVNGCHKETVMQMLAKEHFEESLRIFSQGAEQMI
jgi:hypothetical protein